jgi:class 3 adenylate cyclase/tetratricopeptide (TPR) repeat protein
LEKTCPQCGRPSPADSKFCAECGSDLREVIAAAPPDYSRPRTYTPRLLADKILASRQSMEGERKQVTVLFADVTNFTSISEKLDPEELHGLISECLVFLTEEIHRYEGTILQFLGDGVMALFGAPIAHEYAPHRALHAALAIQQRLVGYAEKLKNRGIEFKMRIGLNTGLVVVGRIGDDLTMDYTAVGDTVNLASRMQTMAEPGTIQITENTHRLTKGFFEFQPLGEVQVKGKEETVKAYRVLGLGSASSRLGVAVTRGLTPFIGREREMELLMDAYERAKSGRGQAISLVGEAGVGKSRFLHEFRKSIEGQDITSIEGTCLSYSRGAAYHVVTDLLKSAFGIREGDRDEQIKDRVNRVLKELGVEESQTSPYLLELLSVKDSGIDRISMSPESRKDHIREALKRSVLKSAGLRPLVVAVEDLHWIDSGSEEVLRYLLESIPGARVLLIFTYRPEYVHTWGGKSYHSQVTLNRLSNRESLAMAAHILGTDQIERSLQDSILEKSEGIPFFIEEFLSSLRDLGMIEKEDGVYRLTKDISQVAIPSTIQEVIMARVDALPESAKAVLQTGSVIEREFSYHLIRKVTQLLESELLSQLSVLRNAELLYERGIYPESSYVFRHALTREVVYGSMLTRRRKQLHVDIADAIEEIHQGDIVQYSEVLAEHYAIGESYEKAAQYCRLAARKAERTASFRDAIAYSNKRVACLEKLPRKGDLPDALVDARVTLGLYWSQIQCFVEAKEAVDPIVDLALQRGNQRRISNIYTVLGDYSFFVDEDFPRAIRYFEDALSIAEKIGDAVSLALTNSSLGLALALDCQFARALRHFEKSLEINEAANSVWGMAVVKSNMAWCVHGWRGEIGRGHHVSNEAVRMAEESGDIYPRAYAHFAHGYLCHAKGDFDEGREHLFKAVQLAGGANFPMLSLLAHHFSSEACCDAGEYARCQEWLEKAIAFHEKYRVLPSFMSLHILALARARVMRNDKDIDLESLYRHEAGNRVKVYEGWMPAYIGEILMCIDGAPLPEAEVWIKKAIEADRRNGMAFDLGNDYRLYAELSRRRGDLSEAKENLQKAIQIFEESGAEGRARTAQEALAGLQEKQTKGKA